MTVLDVQIILAIIGFYAGIPLAVALIAALALRLFVFVLTIGK